MKRYVIFLLFVQEMEPVVNRYGAVNLKTNFIPTWNTIGRTLLAWQMQDPTQMDPSFSSRSFLRWGVWTYQCAWCLESPKHYRVITCELWVMFTMLWFQPWLDNKHTVFARVSRGMEVCQNISNVKTHPKTDKPHDDIKIVSVTIKWVINYGIDWSLLNGHWCAINYFTNDLQYYV